MIRRRIRRRFVRKADPLELLLREMFRTEEDWILRYFEWETARYETSTEIPWWLKPWSLFVVWCAEWQTVWRMRPPTPGQVPVRYRRTGP